MDSNPAARTRRGSSAVIGSWMAAVVATAAPAQRPKVTGSRINRTVPRSRMVARRAANSSSVWFIVVYTGERLAPKLLYSGPEIEGGGWRLGPPTSNLPAYRPA